MPNKLLQILTLLILTTACQTNDSSPRTILAVLAHPDDETTISPVLAKYAQTDSVYLIIATDGQFGVTDHAGIPAGDSLIAIRNEEAKCSCEKMGIHAPIRLDLQDGLGLNGHNNFYEQEARLKVNLLKEIERLKPDVIVTFGPDGDTGHPDHRMVGLVTTELLLRENLTEKIDLYYLGWIKDQAERYKAWNLNYSAKESFNTVITFSDEDEAKSNEAIRCHKSQFPKEEMDKWIETELNDKSNILYFRKFAMDKELRDGF
ncbi:PIG-L deacetylase family protein [uncultured Arcticibacterium sp.]|uniref:PIG-L deacetylase family protein n=1 Tax=uncultured Arcticibacterium sp. TaxID=2173042 RepID=UPI0030F81A44